MNATIKEELTSTRVQRTSNGKYNIIDAQGKALSEEWKWIGYFDPGTGFAKVQRGDNKFNYIDKEGKILSGEWFKNVDEFHCGFARVQREDSKWNFINTKGKLMSNEWFKYISYAMYSENALAYADRTNGEACKIDKTGKIVICK